MTQTLVIATGNRDKAAELSTILESLSCIVTTLAEYPPIEAPVEDGQTFEANARLKALYYAKQLGLPCVADDSGLAVDALDGAPGVYSARYAGPGCTYADNNQKLLAALEGVPGSRRTARFVCCAAFATPEGRVHIEQGTVDGTIAPACRGAQGFGYDPLFIPEGEAKTFAEMSAEAKHRLSHRGRAFARLRNWLAAQ